MSRGSGCLTGRERERDRETERQRQTDRQTDWQAGRDIETVSVQKLSSHVVVLWWSPSFEIWSLLCVVRKGGGGHLMFSSRDGGDGCVM